MALTKIDDRGLKTPVDLLDNEKIRLGTGNDLEIYHSGSESVIKNATGALDIINGSTAIDLKGNDGSETLAKFTPNGAVTLYYDNSPKLETTSAGVTITGSQSKLAGDVRFDNGTNTDKDIYWDESEDRLNFFDSVKATFGNSDDLEIYHDGSNSYLQDAGTGALRIQSNDARIINAAGSEDMARFIENGAVELYYDNSKKLETISTGVQILGDLQLEGDDGTANSVYWDKSDYILKFKDSVNAEWGDGRDLRIYHNGTNDFIQSNGGYLKIQTDSLKIHDRSDDHPMITAVNDGSVELYYDNVKKFHTTTSGAQLTGHLFMDDDNKVQLGTSQDLQLYHDGSHSYIKDAGTGNLQILSNQVNIQGADASEYMAKFHQDSDVELYHNCAEKFATTAQGIRVTGFVKSFSDASDSDKDNTHEQNVMQQHNAGKSILVLENSADSLNYGVHIDFTDNNPDDNVRNFLYCEDSSAARAIIYSSGDVWTSDDAILSSDQTLKENIVDATPKLEDLKKLKVRNFNWKADYHPEKSKVKQLGFIAQEVEQVFPALVTEHDVAGDPLADDHVPNMKKSIRQAWAPILVKALQEAVAKIETLETKVAALEAK